MNCTNHEQTAAAGTCVYCGKPFCADCLVEVKGRMYCKADIGNVLDEAKSAAAATQAQAQPAINIVNTNANTNTNTMGYDAYQIPLKSKITALLLCFFLGGLGVHRFYVGKIGTGILYFCTLGLFGFGVFFDFIFILIGVFKDQYGRKLV